MKQNSMEKLLSVVRTLRSENGCPWDRKQTHESLKPECMEEAAEVIGGINILSSTGKADNLKEELGDLLLQVVFHSLIAEEEGYFTFDDVAETAAEKMIHRHPQVFHQTIQDAEGNPATDWDSIKRIEKAGREWEEGYLPQAFREAEELLQKACERKGIPVQSSHDAEE